MGGKQRIKDMGRNKNINIKLNVANKVFSMLGIEPKTSNLMDVKKAIFKLYGISNPELTVHNSRLMLADQRPANAYGIKITDHELQILMELFGLTPDDWFQENIGGRITRDILNGTLIKSLLSESPVASDIAKQAKPQEPTANILSINLIQSDLSESSDVINDIETHKKEFGSLSKTEQESIIKSRIGQGIFRERVIELWGGCSVSSLSKPSLLRASHIKPWRDCSNQERLDPMNGLLLHPVLDHLFDAGFITFDDNGEIIISDMLSESDIEILHIDRNSKLRKVPDELVKYMRYHREEIFKCKS
jgi:hypothetical protein